MKEDRAAKRSESARTRRYIGLYVMNFEMVNGLRPGEGRTQALGQLEDKLVCSGGTTGWAPSDPSLARDGAGVAACEL